MLALVVVVELDPDEVDAVVEVVVDFVVIDGLVEGVIVVDVVVGFDVTVDIDVVFGIKVDVVFSSVEVCVVTVVLTVVGLTLLEDDGSFVVNSCVDDAGDIFEVVLGLAVEIVVGRGTEVGGRVVCSSVVANAEVEVLGVRDSEDSAISGFVVGDRLGVSVGRVVEVVVVGGNFVVTVRQD